jgi:hypothetical protein
MHDTKESHRPYEAYPPQYQHMHTKGPYPQERPIYEFASKSPVEVSSEHGNFIELAGSDVRSRGA